MKFRFLLVLKALLRFIALQRSSFQRGNQMSLHAWSIYCGWSALGVICGDPHYVIKYFPPSLMAAVCL